MISVIRIKFFLILTQKYLKKSYVVVEFIDEIDEDGKKIVDLLPSLWINTSESLLMCHYPMRGFSNNKLQTWINKWIPPKISWKKFAIRVLQGACKFSFHVP